MFGAMVNIFFFARVQSDHHQPACRVVNPSQCGSSEPFMKAIRQELRSHSMRLRFNGWGYIWGIYNISRVPREIYEEEASAEGNAFVRLWRAWLLGAVTLRDRARLQNVFLQARPSFNFCRIPSVLCYLHDDRMA